MPSIALECRAVESSSGRDLSRLLRRGMVFLRAMILFIPASLQRRRAVPFRRFYSPLQNIRYAGREITRSQPHRVFRRRATPRCHVPCFYDDARKDTFVPNTDKLGFSNARVSQRNNGERAGRVSDSASSTRSEHTARETARLRDCVLDSEAPSPLVLSAVFGVTA